MIEKIKNLFKDKNRVKVPTILQMEAVECGAACLAMIFARHGLWLPLEIIRQECGVNRDGSKASFIIRAARHRGFNADGYKLPADKLRELNMFPMIIHWEFNHFVILEGIKGDTVYLNDPGVGRRSVQWADFRTSYTGVALYFEPNENFKKEGARFNVLKAVMEKLSHDKAAVTFILLLNAAMIVPALAAPIFSQVFLDDILTKKHEDWFFNFMLAMTVSFVVTGAMTFLQAVILTRWQRKLTLADSSKFFWHLINLPMQFFQQRYAAEVATRVNFNESVAGVLSGPAATSLLNLLVAIFYLTLLLQYSVTLTLIGVFFSAVDFIIFFALRRHLTDLNIKIQQDAGKCYGTLLNGIATIETIKATGSEDNFFEKWAGYNVRVVNSSLEMSLWSMTATIIPSLLGGINGALIMTLGGFSIMEGALTAGMFVAFQSLMGGFQAPVNELLGLGSTLQATETQMLRLNDVMKYPAENPDFSSNISTRLNGELQLKDVSFGYSPLSKPLITNFNLHLKPGRWIAIVGASGSGKSTVAKLVTGLYKPWGGDILFDGRPRSEYASSSFQNSVSVVDQDIFLLSGTIRQNLSFFDDSIETYDIIRAAQDACIHDDILALYDGYESTVREGGLNFSGGQRQRLEIARALAINPSLLILDEATSALDPVTELNILQNIRRRGCSCLIVAHRLSTIRDADEIIVLDKGNIIERGTHSELMSYGGYYANLFTNRFQGKNSNS